MKNLATTLIKLEIEFKFKNGLIFIPKETDITNEIKHIISFENLSYTLYNDTYMFHEK